MIGGYKSFQCCPSVFLSFRACQRLLELLQLNMKFISLSLPVISHQGKKYCSSFERVSQLRVSTCVIFRWAPSRVGAKVSRKMARIFCWMLACLLLLHCVDCNGIGAYHKVTLRRQHKHKLEKFVVREFVRQLTLRTQMFWKKIIHHYNTTTINGTHFEPKHFSALISHTFSNIHSLVPVMLGSQVFKTAAATLLETEEKRLKLRSSPSLRVLSKNEMDLSSLNRFRLKNQNSKILPMLPSAPKPPAIPPSFYPPAGPPLPGVNGFANMKYMPMAVKLVKQHQELFDQTFGRVFDPRKRHDGKESRLSRYGSVHFFQSVYKYNCKLM